MSEKTSRQFGLWDSPLTAGSLALGKRLDGVQWDGDGRTLVWLEGRSGQGVLVAQTGDDAPRDLTAELSVRAEVGYGGGDFTVHQGHVYYAVHKTGRIFRQPISWGSARPITPAFGSAASPAVSPDGRWVVYVHHDDQEVDRLAVVDSAGAAWPQILTAGHDFYMQPRWSPDGKKMAWIAWDHPNMPWDGTLLYLADVQYEADRPPRLLKPRVIAGGAQTAIFQPEFTPDGRQLLYVSDETGWGRIAAHDLGSGQNRWLTPEGIECGAPAWVQNMRTYQVAADGGRVIAVASQNGFHRLATIELDSLQLEYVEALAGFSEVTDLAVSRHDGRLALIGSGATLTPRVVLYDSKTGNTRTVARSSGETLPPGELADCQAIAWTSTEGATAHGLLYMPASERFSSPGLPPLVVLVHGGPTGQAKAGWRGEPQFLATRGYAVLAVNYRGSTGYGRDYMLSLRGNWGLHDVDDAVTGKEHLARAGQVDAGRTVVLGGSAGGFTVLETMIRYPDAFTAGVSLYGVANQFHLAAETHKFESRYLDTLLGPLPQAAGVYRDRSPIFHAQAIRRPLAVFQGTIDKVVPREQSDSIVEALRRVGTPHVYHVYEGEGHGWRKRETIEHYYTALDAFLREHVLLA